MESYFSIASRDHGAPSEQDATDAMAGNYSAKQGARKPPENHDDFGCIIEIAAQLDAQDLRRLISYASSLSRKKTTPAQTP